MSNQPSPEQILTQQAYISRASRARTVAQKQQEQSAKQQYSAIVTSFDADAGLYQCQLDDGTILLARSISSTAGRGVGDAVALTKTAAGANVIRYL